MFEFSLATTTDAAALAALVNLAYRPPAELAGWTHESALVAGERTSAAQVVALLVNSVVLVARKESVLVACVHLEAHGEDCHIGMLAVSPELQGAGLGKLLLNHAEAYAREHWQSQCFVMQVLTQRSELLDFYLRRGYQKTGQLSPYPHKAGVGLPKQAGLVLEVLRKAVTEAATD